MKPAFEVLKRNHNSSEITSSSYLFGEAFYKALGYDIDKLQKENAGYVNTCAARMSVALIKSGVTFQGRLTIRSGSYAGRSIEPGAKLLADQLAKPSVFGKPTVIRSPSTAPAELKGKRGVAFFWKITGYDGGHIDVIESSNSVLVCNSHCYFACKEVWFWALR
jgi:Type VI secretion system (T6SS), amidase effector protein 4